MAYQPYFEALAVEEKKNDTLALWWNLSGIWSKKKYERIGQIARHAQESLKKIQISSIDRLDAYTPKFPKLDKTFLWN